MAIVNDDIANKLNELFKSELFKENNFIKIYKLLNIENTPAPAPDTGAADASLTPPASPASPTSTSTSASSSASPSASLTPKGIQKSDKIYNTSISDNQNSYIVIVVFVIVVFNKDGSKNFLINSIYNNDFNEPFLLNKFTDLQKEDLYKADKADKYVKYHISNDLNKYIFCIEPDFRHTNDDTTILVDELFDILTNIYNSIIKIFNELPDTENLTLRLSVPSIMNDSVSIINKKTILGCFSKIYKAKYSKYDLYIENTDLFNYFTKLI